MNNRIQRTADNLRRQADRLLEQAAMLEALPEEPQVDEDGCAVIWFKINFHPEEGGRNYTYAATKAGNLWYLTGQKTGGMRWNDLLTWMIGSQGDLPTIWLASEMTPLS